PGAGGVTPALSGTFPAAGPPAAQPREVGHGRVERVPGGARRRRRAARQVHPGPRSRDEGGEAERQGPRGPAQRLRERDLRQALRRRPGRGVRYVAEAHAVAAEPLPAGARPVPAAADHAAAPTADHAAAAAPIPPPPPAPAPARLRTSPARRPAAPAAAHPAAPAAGPAPAPVPAASADHPPAPAADHAAAAAPVPAPAPVPVRAVRLPAVRVAAVRREARAEASVGEGAW